MKLAHDLFKVCSVVFLTGMFLFFGWIVFATYLVNNECNPAFGYWLLVRAEGDWRLDDAGELEQGMPDRLCIGLNSMSVRGGAVLPFSVPVAAGSVAWSDGSCPVTMQFGTPNNPEVPDLWVQPSGAWMNSPFPWNVRERGFAVSVHIVNGDSGRHPSQTDPTRDQLFVVFDDAKHKAGENRAEKWVRYVRADS